MEQNLYVGTVVLESIKSLCKKVITFFNLLANNISHKMYTVRTKNC